ncbi:MAG: sulfur oxidation c-type cytochrome SoxX [Rhizobiaceae bacterium]|nr:sulfur oxidation c-type cytochrome SoxX [Rhizobiaceae bacterium]
MSLKSNLMMALFLAAAPTAAWAGTIAPDDVKFEEETIVMSLTGEPGDAARGREVFVNRKLGNCLACHVNAEIKEQLFHGEVGPPLDGVADRWEVPELRAIVVNSKIILGDETIMPSFYRVKNGARTAEKFEGKTILSAQDVEDVVAYLGTLKE